MRLLDNTEWSRVAIHNHNKCITRNVIGIATNNCLDKIANANEEENKGLPICTQCGEEFIKDEDTQTLCSYCLCDFTRLQLQNAVIEKPGYYDITNLPDLNPDKKVAENLKLEWVDKETIYKESDLITLHLPLTNQTKNLITERELMLMKKDSMIINTSRGGIINESDLFKVLSKGHLSGAAIDVFEQEPYAGELSRIERCILTSHMGSMSIDCRIKMEIEATEEVVRFISKTPLKGLVPSSEYQFRII
jgi:hypothetical protein